MRNENKQIQTLLNNLQTQLQTQAAETQKAKNELQHQQRTLSYLHQISQNRDSGTEYRKDYRHRDRGRSPSRDNFGYRNQSSTSYRAQEVPKTTITQTIGVDRTALKL